MFEVDCMVIANDNLDVVVAVVVVELIVVVEVLVLFVLLNSVLFYDKKSF